MAWNDSSNLYALWWLEMTTLISKPYDGFKRRLLSLCPMMAWRDNSNFYALWWLEVTMKWQLYSPCPKTAGGDSSNLCPMMGWSDNSYLYPLCWLDVTTLILMPYDGLQWQLLIFMPYDGLKWKLRFLCPMMTWGDNSNLSMPYALLIWSDHCQYLQSWRHWYRVAYCWTSCIQFGNCQCWRKHDPTIKSV